MKGKAPPKLKFPDTLLEAPKFGWVDWTLAIVVGLCALGNGMVALAVAVGETRW